MARAVIFLVRHGETEWNRVHRYQGWGDSPLTHEDAPSEDTLHRSYRSSHIRVFRPAGSCGSRPHAGGAQPYRANSARPWVPCWGEVELDGCQWEIDETQDLEGKKYELKVNFETFQIVKQKEDH
jgi:hypothetical protein